MQNCKLISRQGFSASCVFTVHGAQMSRLKGVGGPPGVLLSSGGGGGASPQTFLPPKRLISPASLLDSQHGCIASPHAKKESSQTPLVVWSPLVQEFLGPGSGFDCCGVWFYSSLLTVRPHLLTVQDQTANGV